MNDAGVLYREPGSSYWPVLWGPLFGLLGLGVEALSGPVHLLGWSVAALALAALALLWVLARRSICSVELTAEHLTLGRDQFPVARIAEVDDVEAPEGTKVLGGGWTTPRGTTDLPVRLDDGSVVLVWAKDGDALRNALCGLLSA